MINLATKYSGVISEKFTNTSYLAGKLCEKYDFSGVKTIQLVAPVTVDLNDYSRTQTQNRYGTPVEMQDETQELTLTQDRSFAMTIDKGNREDQMGIKDASAMLALQMEEKMIPEADKYAFKTLAAQAGTICAMEEPTKQNIVEKIFEGASVLDDAGIVQKNRTLFIPSKYYNMVRLSPEFVGVERLAEDALAKGVVGSICDMAAVKVPNNYFPEGVYFLICQKDSALMPFKMKDTKFHIDPPGISGALLEGRAYYDAFVVRKKGQGVYAAANTDKVCAIPTFTLANNTVAIASTTSGATCYYTEDGSDPRYSSTAKAYSALLTGMAGKTIRACAKKSGLYDSAVAERIISFS